MRKIMITFAVLVSLLCGTMVSFADTNADYAKLELYSIKLEFNQTTHKLKGFSGFTLHNPITGQLDSFKYYDDIKTLSKYVNATYLYDFANNKLLIVSNDGKILYDDLNN